MPETTLSLNVELRSRHDDKSIVGKVADSGAIGTLDRLSEATSIAALVPPQKDAADYDVYIDGQNVTKKVNVLLGRKAFAQLAASFSYYENQLLKNPDPKERYEAVSGLMHFAKAERPLFHALKNDLEPEVRKAVAYALGKRKALGELEDSAQATSLLFHRLKNDVVEVQAAAVEALGEMKTPKVLQALVTASEQKSPEVRSAAIKALAKQSSDQIKRLILEASSDPEPMVRAQAVESLDWYRAEPVVQRRVKEALNDPDGRVRSKAVGILGLCRDRSQEIVPFLVSMLQNDRNPQVKKSTILALQNLGSVSVVQVLLETLQDPNDEVAGYAAETVGRFSDPQVLSALLMVLQDPENNAPLRLGAIRGLRFQDLQDNRVAKLFGEALLNDPNSEVRKEAALSLEKVKAVEPLIVALKVDQAPEVRAAAAEVLGKLQDMQAEGPLTEAMEDKNPEVARCASVALLRLYGF